MLIIISQTVFPLSIYLWICIFLNFFSPDFGGSPSSQDFARDIGNAIGDSGMDTILSDTLILDPIDFDILSDNDPVADQAAEDSFRSDHL